MRLHIGAYRHWGHPFLDYFEGLEQLHERVTRVSQIDELLPPDHLLRDYVVNNVWPNQAVVTQFGHHWHELPLKPYFEVPDGINPSILYSDKSHSMDRGGVIENLSTNP